MAFFVFGEQADVVILQERLLYQLELFLLGHCVDDVLQSVSASIVTRYLNEFVTLYLF